MKVAVSRKTQVFQPVTITLVLETEAELKTFKNLTSNNLTSSEAVAKAFADQRYVPVDQELLSRMLGGIFQGIACLE